jgi:hypothetical protein
MKWNGRSYKPLASKVQKAPFNYQDALKPYGEKEVSVWQVIANVYKEPTASPVPITPTQTPTQTLTPTPTITPSLTPTFTPSPSSIITYYILAEDSDVLQAENNDLIEYET